MDSKAKFATITGACVAVAAILGLWPALSKVLAELPGIVKGLMAGQLFGPWSFFLSWLLGVVTWWVLWALEAVCRGRPHLCSDVWSIGVGWGIYAIQQALNDPAPVEMARALIIGGPLAGGLALIACRIAWAVWAPPKASP